METLIEEVGEVLLTSEQIRQRVSELGKEISRDYAGKSLVVVGILKGAIPFFADLIRQISVPLRYDLMAVHSYGASTKSSGVVQILKDLEEDIENQHVLIVEDIVDTGLTLKYLRENLLARQPASLRICTLLDKPSRRQVEINPEYNGFTIPDHFVVGYGLDYAERFRQLSYIGVLKPEVYTK
jgi:hypoxanthine phosphoribosyltransferase